MSTTIALRFPGHRYHATPWGHHVNEGMIEWPPSPWRILRALISSGFATQAWGESVPPLGRSLIEKLAQELPRYRLPRGLATHSRHYMPAPTDKTLVIDAAAVLDRDPLLISWPIDLEVSEQRLLSALVESLPYLGRAESWVLGEVVEKVDFETLPLVEPHVAGMVKGRGWEQVSVLAPVPVDQYSVWREECVQLQTQPVAAVVGKGSRRGKGKAAAASDAAYPVDLVACLTADTSWLRSHGWSQPPGSQRVLYWRPVDGLTTAPRIALRSRRELSAVEAVLLALASPTAQQQVLPPLWRCLPQAELLHRALIGSEAKGSRIHCPEIIGKDEFGPLKGHRHLHILPLCLGTPDHIDHFLLWAPMGLRDSARQAIRRLQQLGMKGAAAPLRLAVAAEGSLLDILDGLARRDSCSAWVTPGPSRFWSSLTPFVATRHIKARRDTIEDIVQRELTSRGLPPAVRIALLDRDETLALHLHRFERRRRTAEKAPPVDAFFGLRLELAEAIRGPLCLGYASHFGLGLFQPVK